MNNVADGCGQEQRANSPQEKPECPTTQIISHGQEQALSADEAFAQATENQILADASSVPEAPNRITWIWRAYETESD